jgi:hypothetical protein
VEVNKKLYGAFEITHVSDSRPTADYTARGTSTIVRCYFDPYDSIPTHPGLKNSGLRSFGKGSATEEPPLFRAGAGITRHGAFLIGARVHVISPQMRSAKSY